MRSDDDNDSPQPASTVGSFLREIARSPDVSLGELERLPAGSRLGPYELVAPIGAGGMGQVYRARDIRLGRDVAVKVLPREYADHPERRRRFEQEARATAIVDHPNLLAVHDAGTEGEIPYIVFELLEGETLRRRMARGPLSVRQAIEIAAQIARGLAAAHARGITHRDLKPDNVFMTSGDRAKILDFGLAKAARPEDRVEGVASTAPGVVMGSAGYMSPEQVRGEALDHRTDLFALGVIMYEMLSGTRAFDGPLAVQVMNAILTEEPRPLAQVAPSAPPALDRIVHRCLAKDRSDRYQSAHDLAFQLEGVLAQAPSAPVAAASTSKPGWLAWIALAAALGAAALAIAVYVDTRPRGEQAAAGRDGAGEQAAGGSAHAAQRALGAGNTRVVPSSATAEDRHWIQPDDYFISETPWNQGSKNVHLAKLTQPATPPSNEARFFRLDNSREIWTANHWKTRPAEPSELALGTFVLCFNGNARDQLYNPPANKDAARTGSWFLGKVTDTSDASKGWVRVASSKCMLDAIRIAVR
jgi:serine/threonine protein kinase